MKKFFLIALLCVFSFLAGFYTKGSNVSPSFAPQKETMVQHHAEQPSVDGPFSVTPSTRDPVLTDTQPDEISGTEENGQKEPSEIAGKSDDTNRTYAFKEEYIEHSAPRLKPEALESIVGFEYAMLAQPQISEISEDFHKFHREDVDNDWSSRMEFEIRTKINQQDYNGDFIIDGINCKKTLCEVKIKTPSDAAAEFAGSLSSAEPHYRGIVSSIKSGVSGDYKLHYLFVKKG